MTKHLTTMNLDPFIKNTIGVSRFFENMLDRVDRVGRSNSGNYPPYNIIQHDEEHYRLEMAVAGFTRDQINIKLDDRELTISGSEMKDSVTDENVTYVYRGISSRNFYRSFLLDEYVEIVEATLDNGILSVELERKVPESKKVKQIEIK